MKRKGGRTEGPFDIDLGGGGGSDGGGVYKGMPSRYAEGGGGGGRFYAHSLVLTHTTQRSIIEIGSRVCMRSCIQGEPLLFPVKPVRYGQNSFYA